MIRNRHFNYTRPHRAALRLEEIARNADDELHFWAVLAAEFAAENNYDGFFNSQRNYYHWILTQIRSCGLDSWSSYIENFFGDKPDDLRLIICPLDGNYGFRMQSGGKNTSYVIRCMPYYSSANVPLWQFDFFAKGIAHEYAHCFVNPAVEARTDLLCRHEAFFRAHKNMPEYYNVDYAVINEYFVRAFAICFMEHWKFDGFDIDAEYNRQRESFLFIDLFVNQLREFENGGKAFSEFYNEKIEQILSAAEK